MKTHLLTLPLFILYTIAHAQPSDDFSDGNFTHHPTWNGETEKWIVDTNTFELRLNAPEAGTAYLSTPSTVSDNAVWEFYLRMDFNPSSANYAKIYLISDQEDLSAPLNGYFVKVGNTARTISLYRQSGTTETRIIEGPANVVNSSQPQARVQVTRNAAGDWELLADTTGNRNFISYGNTTDATHTHALFSGVACVYTITRADKFFFDEFNDTLAPVIHHIRPLSDTEAEITFREVIDPVTAATPGHYQLNGLTTAITAVRDPEEKNKVRITFPATFPNHTVSTITVNGVADRSGNTTMNQSGTFTYTGFDPFDVLITEVMPNPNPLVALPNAEYAELYNTSSYPVNLNGWRLFTPSRTMWFTSVTLDPGEYLIVCHSDDAPLFQPYGKVYGTASFPPLRIAGNELTLTDKNNVMIHKIIYHPRWYGDAGKSNGGWSLEMIDTKNPCTGAGNWTASVHDRGGTPGQPNSVARSNPDTQPPLLLHAYPETPTQLTLYYDEWLDAASASESSHYHIDEIGVPVYAEPGGAYNNEVTLLLSQPLEKGKHYTITTTGVADCQGNTGFHSTRVALPEHAVQPMDIVINEVLSNPHERGGEFVELYNRSGKVLDLKHLKMANTYTNGTLNQVHPTREEGFLFFPEDHLVLTANEALVTSEYAIENPHWLVEVSQLPAYNNSEGTVVLLDGLSSQRIDVFSYHEDLHFALYKNVKGISFERINPHTATQSDGNWHSAAKNAGFATPTRSNSQLNLATAHDKVVEIIPKVFSPDGDGYDDFTHIHYQLEKPGYVANCWVFDARGRKVRRLAGNMTLATKGKILWDGTTDSREKARKGIYVVLLELFHLDGDRKTIKEAVVVGGRL